MKKSASAVSVADRWRSTIGSAARGVGLGGGDVAVLQHAADHVVAALQGGVRVLRRGS